MEGSWPYSNFVLSNDYNCTNFTSNNQLLEADAVAGPVLSAVLKKDFIPDSILDQLNFSQPNDVVKVLSGNISDLVKHNEAWAAVTIGGGVCLIASLIAVLITLCVFCCLRPNRSRDSCCLNTFLVFLCVVFLAVCGLGGAWYGLSTFALVGQGPEWLVNDTNSYIIHDVKLYGNNTLGQVKHLSGKNLDEFNGYLNQTIDTTMDVVDSVCHQVEIGVELQNVTDVVNFTLVTAQTFKDSDLPSIKDGTSDVLTTFTDIETRLDQILQNISTSFPTLPVDDLDKIIADLRTIDFQSVADQVNSINISQDTIVQISSVNDTLNQAKNTLDDFSDQFRTNYLSSILGQINEITNDVRNKVGNLTDTIEDELDEIKPIAVPSFISDLPPEVKNYAFILSLVPVYVAGLALVFFGLAVVVGPCGGPGSGPRKFGACTLCTSFFVYIALGWLLIVFSTVLFVAGSAGTYACWTLSGETNVLKKLDSFLNDQIQTLVNRTDIDFDPRQMLASCSGDASLYTVLQLSKLYDVDELKNWKETYNITQDIQDILQTVTSKLDEIEGEFEKVNNGSIKSSALNLASQFDTLSDQVLSQLEALDVSGIVANVTKLMSSYIDKLSKLPDTDELVTELQERRNDLNNTLVPDVNNLITTVEEIVKKTKYHDQSMTETVNQLFEIADNATTYMKTTGSNLVLNSTKTATTNFTDLGDSFVNFIVDFVKKDFGACKPVSDMYNAVKVIACDKVVEPLNGVWLGLGSVIAGWTALAILGLCLKRVLGKKNPPRPAYVSRNPNVDNGPSAPPPRYSLVGGIEMMEVSHGPSGSGPHAYGDRGHSMLTGDSRPRLTRQVSGNPHDVAKHYLGSLESKKYH